MLNLFRTLVCILVFSPLAVLAQGKFVISGKVTDAKGNPLSMVAVAIENSKFGTYTDAKGRYKIEVDGGNYVLVATYLGFTTAKKNVSINGAKKVYFELKENSLDLKSVAVYGKTKEQKLRESAYSVNALDIKSIVNSTTNLNDIVGRTTGVKVRNEGGLGSDFELSLNGMSGNSVRYFIDGVPLDTKGGKVSLENIPVSTVERIEVYKGVVPAQLGADALGGAINIITKKENKNYLDVSVSAGSFHTYIADLNAQYVLPKYGIIIKPTFGYSYSKNDYKVKDVEIWNESQSKYVLEDRKRFHDDYKSLIAQVEVGVEDKSWTDAFYIGASYSKVDKDLQTGTVQDIVYGMAERKQHAWNIQARYMKKSFLAKNLTANFFVSHTWDYSVTVDTAYRKYTWDGNWTSTSRNEVTGRARQMRHYDRPLTIARANLNYDFNENHSLNLNYMLSRTGNKRTDELNEDQDFTPSNDVLAKHIIGLSYNQTLFEGKMANVFFLKDYINYVKVEQNDLYWITNSDEVASSTTKNNLGYGVGVRYKFFEPLALKVSYEHTVRLPLAKELLGNGSTVYPNLALKPETSHNVNIGLFGNVNIGDEHSLFYEGGVFYREISDYIHMSISDSEGTAQYENLNDVTQKGIEGEIRYGYSDWLQISANCSYQKALDMNKYKSDGKQSVTYKNKIPNKPWLFANADLTLTKNTLFSNGDKLKFNYAYQYVHWFYLTWEGYGSLSSKARIPTQNIHSASLTYSWQSEKYNVTLECNNLFDATAYDNYRLQKPGRSFMCKFRLFLH